jgi:CBS domain-containing membrane protein
MAALNPRRDLEQISEYVNSTVLTPTPITTAARRGSLPMIKGRHGLNDWLYARWGNRGNAIYTAMGSAIAMVISGAVAWATKEPLVFPSLGATAFLFFETPMAEVASPRNTIIGHFVGAAIGFFWLLVFGLMHKPGAIEAGFTAGRYAAIVLSLSLTGLFLRLMRAAHPPAGATTLIVSLGLLHTWHDMWVLALGVLLVVIPAGMVNRVCGVPAPLWDKPWPGIRTVLHLSHKEPPQPEAPFMGGMLEQWRSLSQPSPSPPVQGTTVPRR